MSHLPPKEMTSYEIVKKWVGYVAGELEGTWGPHIDLGDIDNRIAFLLGKAVASAGWNYELPERETLAILLDNLPEMLEEFELGRKRWRRSYRLARNYRARYNR